MTCRENNEGVQLYFRSDLQDHRPGSTNACSFVDSSLRCPGGQA